MTISDSSSLSRRSRSPAPFPVHILPFIPIKKAMEYPPRATLKPPTTRFNANRAWEERSDQLRKLTLPLAIRIRTQAGSVSPGKNTEGPDLQTLKPEDIEILSKDMSVHEKKRLVTWLSKAETMLEQIEKMKKFTGAYSIPPIWSLSSQSPAKIKEEAVEDVSPCLQSRLQLQARTIRRLYARLSEDIPVLTGTSQSPVKTGKKVASEAPDDMGDTIVWRKSAATKSTSRMSVMSSTESEWIL
jgi:hypothetical protein